MPTIAHQMPEALHQELCDRFGHAATFTRLPTDAPWNVPMGTDALLVGHGVSRALADQGDTAPEWINGLKWLHFRATGIDGIPQWLLRPELVTVSRGAAAPAIAEYVMAAMLSHSLGIPGLWVDSAEGWTKGATGGLVGRTLGLIGFGEIGQEIARRARPFGMRILATRRSGGASGVDGVEIASLEEVLAQGDHLVLCLPLTDATRGLIDAAAMARMTEGAHLINISRGAIVDEDALLRGLDAGRPALLTTDVWSQEPPAKDHWVYRHPQVRLSPHVSYRGPTTEARGQAILMGNVAAWLDGRAERMHGRIQRDAGY